MTSTDNAYTVVYCGEGVAAAVDGLTVTGSTSNGNGGGILNEAGSLTITSCVIRDCNASNGAGVYNSGSLIVADSEFTANSAYFGGGLYNEGNATVSDSTFHENTANERGGGIRSVGGLEVSRSTFSGNTGRSGAGIHGSGTVNVTESIVRDNILSDTVLNSGGGIAVDDGSLNVIDSTISGNTGGFEHFGRRHLRPRQ